MRKFIEFIGANLFLLAILLIGVVAFAAVGVVIKALAPDPDAVPWAWAVAMMAAFVAMGYGGRWLHGVISGLMSYSATARPKSGARDGSS